MTKTFARIIFALVALSYVLSHLVGHAHAQSSLGIGANEATVPSTGLFSGLMQWINVHQQQFYRSLTGALKTMRDNGEGVWALVGLSFAYGVFHAAGPGHGKAVISSYMLANEVALRRGVMLSFVSAFLQAATAIVLIALLFLVLRGSSVSMTNATWFLEVASYVLITLFGAWLLWKKAWPRISSLFGRNPAVSLSSAAHSQAYAASNALSDCDAPNHIHSAACAHGHLRLKQPNARQFQADNDHSTYAYATATAHASTPQDSTAKSTMSALFGGHEHNHGSGEVCETCGHSHAPDPAMLSGDRFDWRTAWSAVAAVGVRPCSGALIVLTFAFLNGLWVGGIVSVLGMAVGTAITVSALATMAVLAKNWAVAVAGDGRAGNRVHAAIEITGAAMVFVLGMLLLTATLSA